MSILSNFEDGIAGLFENVSGSLFRSAVEPVQIIRAAEKEMAKNKLVGPGKTYAPTLYTVLLSTEDDSNLNGFYPTLSNECSTYLIGKANEEGLYLTTKPFVRFMIDDELKTGKFSVIAENISKEELADIRREEEDFWGASSGTSAHVDAPRGVASPSPAPGVSAQPLSGIGVEDLPSGGDFDYEKVADYEDPSRVPPTAPVGEALRGELVDLKSGKAFELIGHVTIGRDPTSTIIIEDVNVSRNHAELFREGTSWTLRDLGSTNGTQVNEHGITRTTLNNGDVIIFGVSRFSFREG